MIFKLWLSEAGLASAHFDREYGINEDVTFKIFCTNKSAMDGCKSKYVEMLEELLERKVYLEWVQTNFSVESISALLKEENKNE